MKRLFGSIIIYFLSILIAYGQLNGNRLKVTPNGHYLEYEDGTPFFWLGDTGWDLFKRLKLDEIKEYLDNRAAKGFNVIQAVALPEPDGLRNANRNGQVPLENFDPTHPNDKFFTLIDSTVHLAAARGIFIGLLPTWGDKVTKMWGTGPVIFDSVNAYIYGKWIGNRYRNDPNIIWIAGGDRPAFTDTIDWRPVWRSMIKGIREGTGGKALITYHPSGESSSTQFWKNESALDLNMMQSGHRMHDLPVWEWIRKDYSLTPAKPVLDGEPNYEDHPVNWDPKNGYFRAYDVRKQIYRSVFSGACGVTYGHNSIFQFYGQHDKKINFADRYWTEALDRPGAFQAGYLKHLILSRPSLYRLPDQGIIENEQGKAGDYMCAFRDSIGSYIMVYIPVGKTVTINTASICSAKLRCWWFNPQTAQVKAIGVISNSKSVQMTSPTQGNGNDWVLVIDDAAKRYKKP
ncbi:MAG: glycoside hydrolase family 140 protein [Ferruginibacter sp.]